ncbi:MAG: TIGR00159 family protein, partial [Candidatus Sulfotelmatobacter sp.]
MSFTVLDILLVGLIVYELLTMIRGTRAAPMLAGLTAVIIAFYLARIGELVTLNWLVSHLLPYVVFALIVVFQ